MNIPESAIRPFEPLGIPVLGTSIGHINKTLNAFFDVVVRTADLADADTQANADIFRSISEQLVVKLGAISGFSSYTGEIRNRQGKLTAVTICVQYVMPDRTCVTNRYRLNVEGVPSGRC